MVFKRFQKKARSYVRKQAKRGYAYVKKRYVKNGSLNINSVKSDVAMLKKLVNAEKKSTNDQSTDYRIIDTGVAQLSTNAPGYYIKDISPSGIIKGTSYDERTGNSIKLHSLVIKGQVRGQSALNNKMRLIIEVWNRKAAAITGPSTAINELFDDNSFLVPALIDYNSTRDKFHYKDYYRMGYKHVTLSADTVSSQITSVSNFTIPLKLNQHATWNFSDTYIAPQIFITVRCDTGNFNATAGTVVGVATNAINTGAILSYSWQYFFYDN